jgi:hypothetical protein
MALFSFLIWAFKKKVTSGSDGGNSPYSCHVLKSAIENRTKLTNYIAFLFSEMAQLIRNGFLTSFVEHNIGLCGLVMGPHCLEYNLGPSNSFLGVVSNKS